MTARGEFDLIARLAAIHAAGPRADVEVGIGDDAAVLSLEGHTVWTVDVQVDHVHFVARRAEAVDRDIEQFAGELIGLRMGEDDERGHCPHSTKPAAWTTVGRRG